MTVSLRVLCRTFQWNLKFQQIVNMWNNTDRQNQSTPGKRKPSVIAFCPPHVPLRQGWVPTVASRVRGQGLTTEHWHGVIQ